MPAHLILLSDREEDRVFSQEVASQYKMAFHMVSRLPDLGRLLVENSLSTVIWAINLPKDAKTTSAVKQVSATIARHLAPERVFALADQPLNESPQLLELGSFNHFWVRKPDTSYLFGKVMERALNPAPFGLSHYLAASDSIKKITLRRSSHARLAVEAVNKVLKTKGVQPRLGALVSSAVGELVMNAIFDAPRDAQWNAYRSGLSRDRDFALSPNELVDIELGVNSKFIAITVSDRFGSLRKEDVLGFIKKDYQNYEYTVKEDIPNAGLGIYRIIRSGLCLLFVSHPRVRTEVTVFFPLVKNFKEFREAFRFFSFLGGRW